MTLRQRLLRLLRVPHEPSAPAGDTNVRIFLAAPNYYYYRLLNFVVTTVPAAIGLYFAIRWSSNLPALIPNAFYENFFWISRRWVEGLWTLLEAGAVVGFIVQSIGSFLLLRLDFEQRWYLVSDRSLRIREGLMRLHEKTMTFANIQEVSIRQGPLQRLLGIADLRVRTAGGGGVDLGEDDAGSGMHIAYFRGIADANAVRDVILDRLKEFKDAGLGDPDEKPSDTSLTEAARALAEEARALRESARPWTRALPSSSR